MLASPPLQYSIRRKLIRMFSLRPRTCLESFRVFCRLHGRVPNVGRESFPSNVVNRNAPRSSPTRGAFRRSASGPDPGARATRRFENRSISSTKSASSSAPGSIRSQELEARAAAAQVQAELARTLPHVMARAAAPKKTSSCAPGWQNRPK